MASTGADFAPGYPVIREAQIAREPRTNSIGAEALLLSTPGASFGFRTRLSRAPVPAYPAGFGEPCLPRAAQSALSGPLWVHEIKFDRFICRREGERVRVFSRHGRDWTDRVPLIAEALLALRATCDARWGACRARRPRGQRFRAVGGLHWRAARRGVTFLYASRSGGIGRTAPDGAWIGSSSRTRTHQPRCAS